MTHHHGMPGRPVGGGVGPDAQDPRTNGPGVLVIDQLLEDSESSIVLATTPAAFHLGHEIVGRMG